MGIKIVIRLLRWNESLKLSNQKLISIPQYISAIFKLGNKGNPLFFKDILKTKPYSKKLALTFVKCTFALSFKYIVNCKCVDWQ